MPFYAVISLQKDNINNKKRKTDRHVQRGGKLIA